MSHLKVQTDCLITHNYKGAHHYACVNISDWSLHCMPCYKHLKHYGAHHYECVDVSSDGYVV